MYFQKPLPWDIALDDIDPDWRWLWSDWADLRAAYIWSVNKDRAYDLSGHNNHLGPVGTNLDLRGDVVGEGWQFDDSGEGYLSCPDNATLDITGELTVAVVALKDAASGANAGLVSKYQGAGSKTNQRSYVLFTREQNTEPLKLTFGVTSAGTFASAVTLSATNNISYGQVFKAVATFRPSTKMRINVDGVIAELTSGVPASIYSGSADLWLGRQFGDSAAQDIQQWDGIAFLALVTARAWSSDQEAQFISDPFGGFRQRNKTWRFGALGAGSVGTAAGTSTVSAVGRATHAAAGSSAGVGTASAVGASTFSAVGSAAGVGTATGVPEVIGTSAGVSTATAVGSSLVEGVGASAGVGAATGVGQSTAEAVGNSAGVGVATGIAGVVGLAAGTSSVTAVGQSTAAATGTAAGTSTVEGVAPGASTGAAAGTSTATAVGVSAFRSVGSAAGSSTAIGKPPAGVGSSAGVAVVTGVGSARVAGAGVSAGVAAVTGAAQFNYPAVGVSNGVAIVAAFFPNSTGAGTSVGLGTAAAYSTSLAAGVSAGLGDVIGIGRALHPLVGVSAGTSSALAVSRRKQGLWTPEDAIPDGVWIPEGHIPGLKVWT